jgi:hypothetical protein
VAGAIVGKQSPAGTSNEAITFGSANIRTKSSMSDFFIGRSIKRVVSSVGIKAHHSSGKSWILVD